MHELSNPIVIAVNPFKETLTAIEVAASCQRAADRFGADCIVLPCSDGGDGLLDALQGSGAIQSVHQETITGPLGKTIHAPIGWLSPREAIIESSLAIGMGLVPSNLRNPMRTHTRGLGELVLAAQSRGARVLHVGLGGSATMDGGTGMAAAWGWIFRDEHGAQLPDGGGSLPRIASADPGNPLVTRVIALIDVQNPLLGPAGARVYAEQKGASPDEADLLSDGLERLVDATSSLASATHAGQIGAGAAGGLGFGISLFAQGVLTPGASWVLDRIGFGEALQRARAVITAEGAFDETSLAGKLTGEVIRRAQSADVPVALLAPTANHVPPGVVVETGNGIWDAQRLEQHAANALRKILHQNA